MSKQLDEHMLQGLLASFGEVLPAWLKNELNAPPSKSVAPELVAGCRDTAKSDPILAAMAKELSAEMSPQSCTGRLRAQEILLATAVGERSSHAPETCALKTLGLNGPCSFRCQPSAAKNTLALWREAIRYMKSNYSFSDGPEAMAGETTGVVRKHLGRLSLERAPLETE